VSLTAFARERAKYKFDLMGVKDFRWEKSGSELAGDHVNLYGKAKGIIHQGHVVFK
jgi:hypothetical protein